LEKKPKNKQKNTELARTQPDKKW